LGSAKTEIKIKFGLASHKTKKAPFGAIYY